MLASIRDPRAGRDHEVAAVTRVRLRNPGNGLARQGHGVARVATAEQYRKLVASQPRNEACAVDEIAQPLSRRDEQGIPGRMAERVIDRLESVQVDERDGNRSLAGAHARFDLG